jgi:hypothetical protein
VSQPAPGLAQGAAAAHQWFHEFQVLQEVVVLGLDLATASVHLAFNRGLIELVPKALSQRICHPGQQQWLLDTGSSWMRITMKTTFMVDGSPQRFLLQMRPRGQPEGGGKVKSIVPTSRLCGPT